MIGVIFQQAHKYEKGVNRIASGRLYQIAQALCVEVGYFFEGIGSDDTFEATEQQRLLLDLARNFISIPVRKHRLRRLAALPHPSAKACTTRIRSMFTSCEGWPGSRICRA